MDKNIKASNSQHNNTTQNLNYPPSITSIPILLASKEPICKIGKINDPFTSKKCTLTKDPQSKTYRLIEERPELRDNPRYSGTIMVDQPSKYLVMHYNPETRKIEASPAGDWCFFKKDITYNTMTVEEAEEKMKNKSFLLDYIRNRGITTKPKGGKKSKKEEIFSRGRAPMGRLNDEDEDIEDEVRPSLFNQVEEQSEEERPEDMDPELKDIPSDIEEEFIKGKKLKEEKKREGYIMEDSSEDALFGDDDDIEGEEEEDSLDNDKDIVDEQGFSEIDEDDDLIPEQANYINLNANSKNMENIVNNANTKDQDFLGVKRKADGSSNISMSGSDRKKQKFEGNGASMEVCLDNLLSKNRTMTHDKIIRDLSRDFEKNDIERRLPILLNTMCDKFSQGSEYFYFKKSEK